MPRTEPDSLPRTAAPMTESMIESAVERGTDYIDRRFMAGQLTQAEYDAELKVLAAWAERRYAEQRG